MFRFYERDLAIYSLATTGNIAAVFRAVLRSRVGSGDFRVERQRTRRTESTHVTLLASGVFYTGRANCLIYKCFASSGEFKIIPGSRYDATLIVLLTQEF